MENGSKVGGGENRANAVAKKIKAVLSYIFIDGLSGMASGLFATLIIGTIICQIGSWISGSFGYYVKAVGSTAKILMGAGIGIGMAYKLKKSPLVSVSSGVAGMVGAFASQIIKRSVFNDSMTLTALSSVGEPLGAFVAAFVALEVGSLVSGKTKIDIILTPLVAIAAGSLVGLLLGPPVSAVMKGLGNLVNTGAAQQPILAGVIVAVIMGVCLTLPISSAAIGVSLGLSGVAAGAAVVGCCSHMVGFAVISYGDNRFGGLIAQGLGTSMLQMPNLVKHPIAWLPPIISSAILGPIAAAWLKITSTPVGSGMGTSGLVGVIETFSQLVRDGKSAWLAAILVAATCFILPAVLNLASYVILRKFKLIKDGDLKLEL